MDYYFNDLPGIGSLCIEHIFYEYDEPILFVCLDSRNNRYLCSCSRIAEQWIVGEITNQQLLDIIDKTLAIDLFFRECKHCFCLKWDGNSLCLFYDIPFDAYPKHNTFLRLRKEQLNEYRSFVESLPSDESQQMVLSTNNAVIREESLKMLKEYVLKAVKEYFPEYNVQACVSLDDAPETDKTQLIFNLISKSSDYSQDSLGTIEKLISAELYPSQKENEPSSVIRDGTIIDKNKSDSVVNNSDLLFAA